MRCGSVIARAVDFGTAVPKGDVGGLLGETERLDVWATARKQWRWCHIGTCMVNCRGGSIRAGTISLVSWLLHMPRH